MSKDSSITAEKIHRLYEDKLGFPNSMDSEKFIPLSKHNEEIRKHNTEIDELMEEKELLIKTSDHNQKLYDELLSRINSIQENAEKQEKDGHDKVCDDINPIEIEMFEHLTSRFIDHCGLERLKNIGSIKSEFQRALDWFGRECYLKGSIKTCKEIKGELK